VITIKDLKIFGRFQDVTSLSYENYIMKD
jgi:hypothetical protein